MFKRAEEERKQLEEEKKKQLERAKAEQVLRYKCLRLAGFTSSHHRDQLVLNVEQLERRKQAIQTELLLRHCSKQKHT